MRTHVAFTAFSLSTLMLFTACGGGGHEDPAMKDHLAMMKADSAIKAAVAAQEASARSIFEMINVGSTDGIENLMAENFIEHQQVDPSITTTGIQGMKDMMAMVRTAYPDYKQEIVSMSTTGDLTYIHFRMTGTNTGPWGASPATGKTMDVMGVDVIRFENGKAAEHWGYMEEMKMMMQLGLMPGPGEEAPKK